MNNKIIFTIGLVVGAAAGSVATYFATRQHFADMANDAMDDYADQCKERIDAIVDYYEGGGDAEETFEKEDDEEEPSNEPEEFRANEGVKKYHHYADASFGSESAQSIFKKDNVKEVAGAVRFKTEEEKVTEGQKDILKRPELEDVPGVDEIEAEEFDLLDDDEYTRVYLRYDFNKDELTTNDGELAESAYAKTRSELIGNVWKWAPDYIDEKTGDGDFFIKNDNLKIGFQVGVIFDPDKPVVEVG